MYFRHEDKWFIVDNLVTSRLEVHREDFVDHIKRLGYLHCGRVRLCVCVCVRERERERERES